MMKSNSLQDRRIQRLRVLVQLAAVLLNVWVLGNTVHAGLWLFSLVSVLETILMMVTTLIKPKAITKDWWGWTASIFIMIFPLTATDVLQTHTVIPLGRIFVGDFLMLIAVLLEIVSLVYLNTAFTQVPEARKVVVKGPYRYIRHPLYVSYVLVYLGQAVQWDELLYWITMVIFLVVLVFRAKAEENILRQTFSTYEAYQQKTLC